MVFIETPIFTRLITELLDDDEYSKLQMELSIHPAAGDLIKNQKWWRHPKTALEASRNG